MKVGIDIEKIDRMNKKLLDRIATPAEKEYVTSHGDSLRHIASLWTAKEAAIKMLGDTTLSPLEIEILHQKNGRPYLVLYGLALDCAKKQNLTEFDISISHNPTDAIAIVIGK